MTPGPLRPPCQTLAYNARVRVSEDAELPGHVIGPLRTGAAWNAELVQMPGVTPYQRHEWLRAWAAGGGGAPVFVSDPHGRYQFGGVVAGDECGRPELYIARGPVGQDWRAVVDATLVACDTVPCASVRVGPYLAWDDGGSRVHAALTAAGFRPSGARFHNLTAVVPLDSEERILRRASKSFRYSVGRARREGISVSCDNSPEAASGFYELYAEFMADKVPQLDSRAFFLELIARFDPHDLGTLLFARTSGGTLASAALVLRAGPLAWLSRAPRPPLAEPFSAFLQLHAMRWAMARGCSRYDLGGIEASPDGEPRPTGLTWFKRAAGSSLVRIVPELVRRAP